MSTKGQVAGDTGRVRYLAEPYDLGDDGVQRLQQLVSEGWFVWLAPGYSLHFPGRTQVVMIESADSASIGEIYSGGSHEPFTSPVTPYRESPPELTSRQDPAPADDAS